MTITDAAGLVLKSETLRYDGFDLRISRSVDEDGVGAGAASTENVILDRDQIALVLDDAGKLAQSYLHGPRTDMVLAQDSGGQMQWLLADGTQTVRDVVDAAGALRNHLTYDSFGQIVSQSDTVFQPRFSFTGREYDPVSALYYYRARYYDGALHRFISEDPKGLPAGDMNLYRYAGNDPLNRMDPTGMDWESIKDEWVTPAWETAKDAVSWEGIKSSGRFLRGEGKSVAKFVKETVWDLGVLISYAVNKGLGKATGSDYFNSNANYLYQEEIAPKIEGFTQLKTQFSDPPDAFAAR